MVIGLALTIMGRMLCLQDSWRGGETGYVILEKGSLTYLRLELVLFLRLLMGPRKHIVGMNCCFL